MAFLDSLALYYLSGPANMVAAIIKVNEDHMKTE
jgi:hypothetical protein